MSRKNGRQPEMTSPVVSTLREGPTDDVARERWPTLAPCLWPVWRDEKCVRQAGSLKLTIAGDHYFLKLSCPTEGVECLLITTTLVDILDQMEQLLQSGRAVWIPDYETTKRARQARIK